MFELDSYKWFEKDNLISQIVLEKAFAYSISNSDILTYVLFSKTSIPPMWANYIKMPNNKILFEKFIKNVDLVDKKIAENFETKILENKNISKKMKSLFSFEELQNIQNKHLMAVEVIEMYTNHGFDDLYEKIGECIENNNASYVALIYLLSYLCFDEQKRQKIVERVKEQSEFFLEKVRFSIEILFDFTVGVLRLSKKERYDVFINKELLEMAEYMSKEKQQIMESFQSDEKKYLAMIDMLTNQLNQLEKENLDLKNQYPSKKLPLKSKNILVIGDTGRKDSYKEIVEKYGGNFDFMDGIYEPEKISSLVDKTDLAILVIPRMKHSVSNILKSKKVSTIFVNSAGISSFEEVMDNYCCG
jgi:hypothetical protein